MRAFALPLLAVLGLVLGCEPVGPIAGGRLSGEVAETPSDWAFANAVDTIQIETRPSAPHSVTVWCVSWHGALYVPTRDPRTKRWVKYVLDDPRVRVRVNGVIYEGLAVRVTDPAELDGVVPALLAKYHIDASEAEEADAWIFRIDPRPPPPVPQEGGVSSAPGSAATASASG